MKVLEYSSGTTRVELQQRPLSLPTTIATSNPGILNQIKNVSAKWAVFVWEGNLLDQLTPSNSWAGAFGQFRSRVSTRLGISVPDLVPGKTSIVDGKVV